MKKPFRPALKRSGRILPSGVIEIEEAGFVEGPFTYESTLEKWLVDHFDELKLDAALIGSQVQFQKGKKTDLLAVLRDGRICLIENKRDCAPREALAQILDYSMELNELLPGELDEICQSRNIRRQKFKAIYAQHFKQPYPDHPPSTPLLVLIADSFEEEEENLALFLNQKHGFQIRLIRFEAEGVGPDKVVKFIPVVGESDQVMPLGALPPNTFVVRVEERYRHSWEDMRANNYFAVDPKFAGALQLEIEKNEPVTILVYLRWAGFVGYGGLKEILKDEDGGKSGNGCANVKPKAGRSKSPKDLDHRTFFSVEWAQTLPREQAYFRMQANQPSRPVEVFSDPVLWRIIVGRLQFRSDKLTAP